MKTLLILILGALTLFFGSLFVSDIFWPVGLQSFLEGLVITLCLVAALIWVFRHTGEDAMKKWWVVLLALFVLRLFHNVDQNLEQPTVVATPRAQTRVVIFSPWAAGTLRRGFKISRKVAGSCWTRSLSTDRADAWRCMAGNDIYDPCFAGPSRSALLACAEGPFSKRAVLLNVAKPLSGGWNSTTALLQPKGQPWGLQLTNGDTCVFVTGATDVVAGERLNYACGNTGWVLGAPERSTAIWTAQSVHWQEGSQRPGRHLSGVRIATAVF